MTLDQIIRNTCAIQAAVIAAIGLTALALAHLFRSDPTPLEDLRSTKFQIAYFSLHEVLRSSLARQMAAATVPDSIGAKPNKKFLESLDLTTFESPHNREEKYHV